MGDLWGQGVIHGFMASAAFFRPQDGMQESNVLHIVAFRFWVRPCSFEEGGGGAGLGGRVRWRELVTSWSGV